MPSFFFYDWESTLKSGLIVVYSPTDFVQNLQHGIELWINALNKAVPLIFPLNDNSCLLDTPLVRQREGSLVGK